MTRTLRTACVGALMLVVSSSIAFAQIVSGQICDVNWNNSQSNDVKRDDVNRGALMIAVNGETANLFAIPGTKGLKTPLPTASLDEWTFVQKVQLMRDGSGYRFTYASPKLGTTILVTLVPKGGGFEMTMGQDGKARNGTGQMQCRSNSPLFAAANARMASR